MTTIAVKRGRLFLPHAKRLRRGSELYTLIGFLSVDECRQLIAIIRAHRRPSMMTEGPNPAGYRTGSTADLGLLNHQLIDEIDRRICLLMGLAPRLSEPIQGQYYEVGQDFKAHTDYFKRSELPTYARRLGQRTYTFMVYLNDSSGTSNGGQTHFPRLGITIKPRAGMAVIWNNLRAGVPNPLMLHSALPVRRGHKAVLTKWFRSGRRRTAFRKEANEYLPAFSPTGFQKELVPPRLFRKLSAWFRVHSTAQRQEKNVWNFVRSGRAKRKPTSIVELPDDLKREIKETLAPIVRRWVGRPVRPTYVYGVRVYHRFATVRPHRDRLRTHILGTIINLDQKARRKWPLRIHDHYYRDHQVFLRPGEMLLYESARLLHSRLTPFQGQHFANIFCHFVLSQRPGSSRRLANRSLP
jgi:prolyl 4-hydroxylase